jgi:hypothetical protein
MRYFCFINLLSLMLDERQCDSPVFDTNKCKSFFIFTVSSAFGSHGVFERSDFLNLTQVNIPVKPSLHMGLL